MKKLIALKHKLDEMKAMGTNAKRGIGQHG